MTAPLFEPVNRTVENLISDIIEGSIGLPDLQRPFAWKDSDVRNLLNSMLHGYPIGYCILWEAPDDQEDKKASIGLNSKAYSAPKDLVIDSQQRLTALTSALYGVTVKDQSFSDRTLPIATTREWGIRTVMESSGSSEILGLPLMTSPKRM